LAREGTAAIQQETQATAGDDALTTPVSEPITTRGRGIRWRDLAISALTVLYFVFALFPVVWMIILSLKPQDKLFTTYFQFEPTLAAYIEIFSGTGGQAGATYLRFFMNSLVVSLGAVLVSLVVGVPAAYAFARWNFRGGESLLFTLLSFRFAPELMVIIPLLVIYRRLGLFDTHLGLIWVYQLITLPLIVWILRSYFQDLTPEPATGLPQGGRAADPARTGSSGSAGLHLCLELLYLPVCSDREQRADGDGWVTLLSRGRHTSLQPDGGRSPDCPHPALAARALDPTIPGSWTDLRGGEGVVSVAGG
jgi:hypothetical protein